MNFQQTILLTLRLYWGNLGVCLWTEYGIKALSLMTHFQSLYNYWLTYFYTGMVYKFTKVFFLQPCLTRILKGKDNKKLKPISVPQNSKNVGSLPFHLDDKIFITSILCLMVHLHCLNRESQIPRTSTQNPMGIWRDMCVPVVWYCACPVLVPRSVNKNWLTLNFHIYSAW